VLDGHRVPFTIEVQPVLHEGETFLLVCFVDAPAPLPQKSGRPATDSVRVATLENELDTMRTDTAALLENGLALAKDAFDASVEAGWEWSSCDRYVMHQVSAVHTNRLCELLGVDMNLVPLTYPDFGNMGPAAVPYTLSTVAADIVPGERVLLMGIGSGLNCAAAELIW